MYHSCFIHSHSSFLTMLVSLSYAIYRGFLSMLLSVTCIIHYRPFNNHLLIEIIWYSLGFLILYIPLIRFAISGEFVCIIINFFSRFSILHRMFCNSAASAMYCVTFIDPEHLRYPPDWRTIL